MPAQNDFLSVLKKYLRPQANYKQTQKDHAVSEMFRTLYSNSLAEKYPLLLCTNHGIVLSDISELKRNASSYNSSGESQCYHLDTELLLSENLQFHSWKPISDYTVISRMQDQAEADFSSFLTQLAQALKILDSQYAYTNRLLKSLDSVKKSISIFDNEGRLLFGNKYFCDYLYINNRDEVLGMSVNDIIAKNGTKIYSIDTNSNELKMFDVLKKGQEVIDWEVRITSSKGDTQLVGNDMYPVFDQFGNVDGMVEITHSRKQILDHAKKYAGLSAEYSFDNISGSSIAIREAIRTAKDYADSHLSLLITGESGVGKELFAQSVHNYSSRSKGPFVALNCASFPENLIESELFGYVGGAFTGASKHGQMGKFELADGGTLFLDEVGELPIHFQSKLLRILETWTITRIGSSKQVPINVRLIAATNRDLAKMVEEGLFRQDLYYRLQILNVRIPPLRERRDDILILVDDLLSQSKNPDSDIPKTLSDDSRRLLLEYDWPGNVRELRNVLYRAALLSKSSIITKDVLLLSMSANGSLSKLPQEPISLASTLSDSERLAKRQEEVDDANKKLIAEAIDIAGGNRSKAADILGISRNTLYRSMEKYHIGLKSKEPHL